LDGEPKSERDTNYFSGSDLSLYALPESKIRMAISKGAIGTIIIPSANPGPGDTWQKKQIEYSFEDISLPGKVTSQLGVSLNKESAHLLFSGSQYEYDDILEKELNYSLEPFDLNVKIAFNGQFKLKEFKSANVISTIPGRDPVLKNEYIVIGAHYDHLGIGKTVNGDSIYNGVGDNALGTAVAMELARMFSELELAPRRSLIIIFFTGEEKGLLGSEYYSNHPYVPPTQTIAMVNIDGLSAMGKFSSLYGIGASYSSLGEILTDIAAERGFRLEYLDRSNLKSLYSRSDQLSFAKMGIPSIMIIEGFDYKDINRSEAISANQNWFKNIYHTPLDDLNQPIDYNAVKRYTDFIFAYCNRLLNMSAKIEWNENAPYKNIRLRNQAMSDNK
jgi:Zn-dependent M28 family amino/carboxypeptidase